MDRARSCSTRPRTACGRRTRSCTSCCGRRPTTDHPPTPHPAPPPITDPMLKIAIAYSGGLDTSCMIPWLKENMDCEIVAVVGDVGQGAHELVGVEEKAKRSGAVACHVVDLKRAFLEEFVFPTMLAGAK